MPLPAAGFAFMVQPRIESGLVDANALAAEIRRLALRHTRRGTIDVPDAEGLTFGDLLAHQNGVARRLAREIRSGAYRFGPVRPRRIRLDGRMRTIYAASVLDTVVLAALAGSLTAMLDPLLPQSLHSYRRGRSSWRAVSLLAGFLRAHRRARPRPRDRGLYVLRRDVQAYGESIPVGEESLLWNELDALLRQAGRGDAPAVSALLARAVRPRVAYPDGSIKTLPTGVPTGSALQPLVNNAYLAPLDRELERIEAGFYARYGDDIVFAHPDARVAQEASQRIDRLVADRGLQIHPQKRSDHYFNGAGRASQAWPEARGTSVLDYLGYRIRFQGTVAMKTIRQRELFTQLGRRLAHGDQLLTDADPGTRLSTLCAVVNRALDPGCALCVPAASALRYLVNDRGQLRDFDYRIARTLAQRLSGIRGVRAFRRVPYGRLRSRGALLSLVDRRNRAGRPGRTERGS